MGESVVEPVQPVEQEPQIPDDAPGFYTTRQEMNGWEVFSLSTAQDLIDLSDWVQGGEDTAGRIFVLEDSIDLGGVDFVPIGTRENPFRGAFLGRGYSVTGLSVTVPDYGASAGLFGHLSYATVDSLQVSGTVTACHWAGGLVGYAEGSTIENCSFTGSVNGVLSDIGGAGTEVCDLSKDSASHRRSLPFGVLDLHRKFVSRIQPDEKEGEKIRKFVRKKFNNTV